MNKKFLVGILLFLSIALNVTFASMLFARHAGIGLENKHPALAMIGRIRSLSEEQRVQVKEIIMQNRQGLREVMVDVKDTRRNIFDYIKSNDYKREEAATKLALLRDKTTAAQLQAQTVMLDIADKLTPEQRTEFFKQKSGILP